jgi:hypothetical protein
LTAKVEQEFEAVLSELKKICRLLPKDFSSYGVGDGEDTGKALPADGKSHDKKKKGDTRRCYYCGKRGHLKKDCKIFKEKKKGEQATVLTLTGLENERAQVFVMGKKNAAGLLLDSGATHHVVTDPGALSKCVPSRIRCVEVGGGKTLSVLCEGSLDLIGDNSLVTLTGVLCVPDIGCDLVSSPALTEKGAHVRLDSQCALIYGPDGRVVLTARKHMRKYIIQASVVEPDSAASAFVVSADIVHQRLGHPGQKVSEIYAGQMGAEGEVKDCQVCVQAKQTRGPFPPSDTTTTRPLELIHSDLIGPFHNASLEGARYALTIMDDYTRFSEVHFLKTKDGVFR